MTNFYFYWQAKVQAVIKGDQAPKAWQSGLGFKKIEYLNKAFEVYYNARKNLEECDDTKRRSRMVADLEKCAASGWSFTGVSNLKAAFEHLAKNDRWNDEKWEQYDFGKIPKWGLYPVTFPPMAAVEFFKALDSKLEESWDFTSKLDSEKDKLNRLCQKGEKLTKTEALSAAEILKKMEEGHDKAEWVLWCTARGEEVAEVAKVTGNIAKFFEKVEKFSHHAEFFNETLGKGLGVVKDLGTGMETYERAKNSGLSDGAAATIAILQRSMEFVPIFGKLYGEALGVIPDTMEIIQKHADDLKLARQQLGLE